MIGIIPAAGRGTRLGKGNKALAKLNGRPMIEYPLTTLAMNGVTKTIIIVSDDEIMKAIGFEFFGMTISYVKQEEPKGIAHAISQVEPFIENDENLFIIFADVIYKGTIGDLEIPGNFIAQWGAAPLSVDTMDSISRSYGETKDGQIIEKPKKLDNFTPYLGLGIYKVTTEIFDYIRRTPVSNLRNEVEFTDTLNLIPKNRRMKIILDDYYANINTPQEFDETENEVRKW